MFFRLILLLQITVFILLCSCGSGTVVGNPDISGKITSDGKPVSACKVVLGPLLRDPGTVELVTGVNEAKIVGSRKKFTTTYTDTNGFFKFKALEQGAYCILAEKDNLMGIYEQIDLGYADSLNVGDIKIKHTSKLTIDNYSSVMDTIENNFITATVDGTELKPQADIKDRLYFSAIPVGIYDIILYRENKTFECIKALDVKSNDSNITIQINPATPPEEWTYRSVIPRNSRPYILDYGFESAPISYPYSFSHYCWIQFSHDMETRITGNAIKAFSSDSLTKINKIRWEGSNQLLIDLCTNGAAACSDDTTSLKKGVTYSIVIDTTARTIAGHTLAWPDTFKITP
jgi:hypothetical protein